MEISNMFLQIKSNKKLIAQINVDEYIIDSVVRDSDDILGLSVRKKGEMDGTIYMSTDNTFHFLGISSKPLSPKIVEKICTLPTPRSRREIREIIKEQK
jgi:hypothetical protein